MVRIRTLTAIFVLLMGLSLLACGGESTSISAVGSIPNAAATYSDPLFELTMPPGWRMVAESGTDPRAVFFEDGLGYSVIIWIWPQGSWQYSDFAADMVWELDWTDPGRTRLLVAQERLPCAAGGLGQSQFCSVGDGRLKVYAKVDFARAFSAGHQFQFEFMYRFGEDRSQLPVFRNILQGFRVRSAPGA